MKASEMSTSEILTHISMGLAVLEIVWEALETGKSLRDIDPEMDEDLSPLQALKTM